jgi:N-methylhydantoinase A/oxoprolinase/acetone carboxylase beta subunit
MEGPVVIEDHESTTIVPPGATLSVDGERMLVLDLKGILS